MRRRLGVPLGSGQDAGVGTVAPGTVGGGGSGESFTGENAAGKNDAAASPAEESPAGERTADGAGARQPVLGRTDSEREVSA
jgi:hypothetical protein